MPPWVSWWAINVIKQTIVGIWLETINWQKDDAIYWIACIWSCSSAPPRFLLTPCSSLVPWNPLPRPSNFITTAPWELIKTLSQFTPNLSVTLWVPGVPSLKQEQSNFLFSVIQQSRKIQGRISLSVCLYTRLSRFPREDSFHPCSYHGIRQRLKPEPIVRGKETVSKAKLMLKYNFTNSFVFWCGADLDIQTTEDCRKCKYGCGSIFTDLGNTWQ